MDEELLEAWAREAGMSPLSAHGVAHGWGDMEISYHVRAVDYRACVEVVSRGNRRTLASFANTDDADRLLLLLFAAEWRSRSLLSSFQPLHYSPNVKVELSSTATVLRWDGADALFSAGNAGRFYAVPFSYLAGQSPLDIHLSLRDRDGHPLLRV